MNLRTVSTASLAVLLIAIAGAAVASAGTTATKKTTATMTLYSVATEEQFVNNADDRQRGKGNNPFGNYKDQTATTKESGNGPFPGDEALFAFNIYASSALSKPVGKAVFTCQYNFDKNAFCDATYALSDGTLIASGPFNFNAPTFDIAIIGGTGKYRGARGDLKASPAVKHAQKLAISLG